jgi:hypothetical protein
VRSRTASRDVWLHEPWTLRTSSFQYRIFLDARIPARGGGTRRWYSDRGAGSSQDPRQFCGFSSSVRATSSGGPFHIDLAGRRYPAPWEDAIQRTRARTATYRSQAQTRRPARRHGSRVPDLGATIVLYQDPEVRLHGRGRRDPVRHQQLTQLADSTRRASGTPRLHPTTGHVVGLPRRTDMSTASTGPQEVRRDALGTHCCGGEAASRSDSYNRMEGAIVIYRHALVDTCSPFVDGTEAHRATGDRGSPGVPATLRPSSSEHRRTS